MPDPPVKGGRTTRSSPKSPVAQGDADKHARAMDENWRSLYKSTYPYRSCTWVEKLGPVLWYDGSPLADGRDATRARPDKFD